MKITNKLVILFVLFMTMHPFGALAAPEGGGDISEEEAIKIAQEHILATATGNVTAKGIELERERNNLIYTIKLEDEASVIYAISVDANTGSVLLPEDEEVDTSAKNNKDDSFDDPDKMKKMVFVDSSGTIEGKYVAFTHTRYAEIHDFTVQGTKIFSTISIEDFTPSNIKIAGSQAKFEMNIDKGLNKVGTAATEDETAETGTENATEDSKKDAMKNPKNDATEDATEDVTLDLKGTEDKTPEGTEDKEPDKTEDETPHMTEAETVDAMEPEKESKDDDDDNEKIKFELNDNANGLIKIDVTGTRTVSFQLAEGITAKGDGPIILTGEDFSGSIQQIGHEAGSVSFLKDGNTITVLVTDAKLMFRSYPGGTGKEKADHEARVIQGIIDGNVAAEVDIEDGESTNTVVYDGITISIDTIKDDVVNINVNSEMTTGTTISLSVSSDILKSIQKEKVTILYDGEPIELAGNYDDIMNPDDDSGKAEYLALVGADGVEVLISIPHFSPHSITITTGEQKPASQPGFGFGLAVMGILVLYLIYRRKDE